MRTHPESRGRAVSRVAAVGIAVSSLICGEALTSQSQTPIKHPKVNTEPKPEHLKDGLTAFAGKILKHVIHRSAHEQMSAPVIAPVAPAPTPTTTTTTEALPPPVTTTTTTTTAPLPVTTTGIPASELPAVLLRIGGCETENSPTAAINYNSVNTQGSTASGGFQFLDTTWHDFEGYPRALDAPPDVQNYKALLTYQTEGTSPWVSSEDCWG